MNTAVRFYTRSGNTEKLAGAIAAAAGVTAEPVTCGLTEKVDVLFLGCSYYAFDVDESVKRFIMDNREKIGLIVCFGTSAMMKSVLKPLQEAAAAAGVALSPEEFHCRGSFAFMHKGRPDQNDLMHAADFARRLLKNMK